MLVGLTLCSCIEVLKKKDTCNPEISYNKVTQVSGDVLECAVGVFKLATRPRTRPITICKQTAPPPSSTPLLWVAITSGVVGQLNTLRLPAGIYEDMALVITQPLL